MSHLTQMKPIDLPDTRCEDGEGEGGRKS